MLVEIEYSIAVDDGICFSPLVDDSDALFVELEKTHVLHQLSTHNNRFRLNNHDNLSFHFTEQKADRHS